MKGTDLLWLAYLVLMCMVRYLVIFVLIGVVMLLILLGGLT